MTGAEIINTFYSSFHRHDAEAMAALYAPNAVFTDDVFGELRGADIGNMWRMLLTKTDVEVVCSHVVADERSGTAQWVATYTFTKTGRKVVNRVAASFVFENGQIVRHADVFDFWKWSRQALGVSGWLLGWSPVLKSAVRKQALDGLRRFGNR
jgi:ketosteroid isomerase-like protein